MSEDFPQLGEHRYLVDQSDANRMRQFAFRHRIGDSAYLLRRLMDIAEEAERLGIVGEHGAVERRPVSRFKCDQNHIGGPGVRVGRGCVHAGPMGLALVLGLVTLAAALTNPSVPWWGDVLAALLWPVFSFVGQTIL